MKQTTIGNKKFEAYRRKIGNIGIYVDTQWGQNFLMQFANNDELTNFISFLNEVKEEGNEMICKTCGGSGLITYQENQSPLGSGEYWPMTMTDECPDCIGKGKCPRCGYYNDFENQDSPLKCTHCGWTEDEQEVE